MPAFSVNVILFSHSQDGCPIVPPSRIHVTRSSPGLEKVAPCLHVSLSLSLSLSIRKAYLPRNAQKALLQIVEEWDTCSHFCCKGRNMRVSGGKQMRKRNVPYNYQLYYTKLQKCFKNVILPQELTNLIDRQLNGTAKIR